MLTRNQYLPAFILVALVIGCGATTVMAQASLAEFQKTLQQKAGFEAADFAALQSEQPVVKLSPVADKREVAVAGLVNIRVGVDEFVRSYRGSMARKNNEAILEIGSFGREPALADLRDLTIEGRDIEDLKACVVGDCEVKLSAPMIERFKNEINWQAPDYQQQVTSLFKHLLLDYVRDYRTRGETALIAYNDKRTEISLAAEQQALNTATSYVNDQLGERQLKDLQIIEDALVWSKIKFGLKPVIAINHIIIYRRNHGVGPQVLIASRQIYANHYFNASLALTAFVSVSDASQGSYLVYENRSRADGLEGPFSKLKRNIVEKKAVEGLRNILEHSKASIEGRTLAAAATDYAASRSRGWGQRLFGGIRPLLWLLMLSALIALLVLGRRRTEPVKPGERKALKPESAKS
jgi:hypothetical protein